ncbi:hypothetical protein J4Q44_G00102520 [Coregonus suidteri]|uniref:Uncharacterized protein n=1 Tax=Coregonus suidteri TaxID=861788 RepID=A0AAN8R055_9TELE
MSVDLTVLVVCIFPHIHSRHVSIDPRSIRQKQCPKKKNCDICNGRCMRHFLKLKYIFICSTVSLLQQMMMETVFFE